jgi:hypothetical protein
MSKKHNEPDDIKRDSNSLFGTGFFTVHETRIEKGSETYTGYGDTKEEADKEAGDKYRTGDKDYKDKG